MLLPSAASLADGMTLRGRPRRPASMLYARAAASSVAWCPSHLPLHVALNFPRLLSQPTPLNVAVKVEARARGARSLSGTTPSLT